MKKLFRYILAGTLTTSMIFNSVPAPILAATKEIKTSGDLESESNPIVKDYMKARYNKEAAEANLKSTRENRLNDLEAMHNAQQKLIAAQLSFNNANTQLSTAYTFPGGNKDDILQNYYNVHKSEYIPSGENLLNQAQQQAGQSNTQSVNISDYSKWESNSSTILKWAEDEIKNNVEPMYEKLGAEMVSQGLAKVDSSGTYTFEWDKGSNMPDDWHKLLTLRQHYIQLLSSCNRANSYVSIGFKYHATTETPALEQDLQDKLLKAINFCSSFEVNCYNYASPHYTQLLGDYCTVGTASLTNTFNQDIIGLSSISRLYNITFPTALQYYYPSGYTAKDGHPTDVSDCIYCQEIAKDSMGHALLFAASMSDPKAVTGKEAADITKEDLQGYTGLPEYFKSMKEELDLTIQFYKNIGYDGIAAKIEELYEKQKTLIETVEKNTGVNLIDSSSSGDSQTTDEADSAIFDTSGDEITLTPAGEALYSWTSAFSPFSTNIFELEDVASPMADTVMSVYTANNANDKYLPLYIVDDTANAYKSLALGATKKMSVATLATLIDKLEEGDIALFVDVRNDEDRLSDKVSSTSAETKDDGSTTVQSTVTTLDNYSFTGSSDFYGPVYLSAPINKYSKGDESTFSNKKGSSIDDIDTILQSNKNIGMDTSSAYASVGQTKAITANVSVDMLHMNYLILHNTLEDSGPALTNLDAELFIDVLGNIITEDGYVVIPAASNCTYYQTASSYPIYNAAFLNSYPKITYASDKEVQLADIDAKKVFFGHTLQYEEEGASSFDPSKATSTMGFYKLNNNKPKRMCISKTFGQGDFYWDDSPDKEPIDFMDPTTSYIATGQTTKKGIWFLTSYYGTSYFTLSKSNIAVETFVNGVKLRSVMNAIPNIADSPYWSILISGFSRYLDKCNNTEDGLFLDIMKTIQEKVTTSGKDIASLKSYSANINKVSYKDIAKEVGIGAHICAWLEDVVNLSFRQCKTNRLFCSNTFSMTFDDGIIATAALPIALVAISIAFIIVIVYVIILLARGDGSSSFLKLVAFLCTAVILTVYIYIPQSSEAMRSISSIAAGKHAFDFLIYDKESEYKEDLSTVFSNRVNTDFTKEDVELRLKHLDNREIKEYRGNQGITRYEVNSPLYNATYDNNRYYVKEGILYMHNDYLYTTVDTLLNSTSIQTPISTETSCPMQVELLDEGVTTTLQYYLPFYIIEEGLVETINAFNDNNVNAYKTINYGLGQVKGSGRCSAYFHSIFFMQPSDIDHYIETHMANTKVALANQQGMMDADKYQKELDTLEQSNEMMRSAYVYIQDELGDSDDWLHLKDGLLLNTRNGVFDSFDPQATLTARWYPTNRGFTMEDIDERIKRINKNTKDFVISHINPISNIISDETAVEITALYATIQYNKEFSKFTGEQLYPKRIETDYLDNKYLAVSPFMTRKALFTSTDQSSAYYLSQKVSDFTLGCSVADLYAFNICTWCYQLNLKFLNLLPFFLILFCIFRGSPLALKIWDIIGTNISVTVLWFIHCVIFTLITHLTKYLSPTGMIAVNSIVDLLFLFVAGRSTVKLFKAVIEFTKNCFLSMAGATQHITDPLTRLAISNSKEEVNKYIANERHMLGSNIQPAFRSSNSIPNELENRNSNQQYITSYDQILGSRHPNNNSYIRREH